MPEAAADIRIVHVTREHAADDVRLYAKEVRALAAEFDDIWIVAPPPRGGSVEPARWIEAPVASSVLRPWRGMRATSRAVRSIAEPRLVHAHEPATVVAAALLRWCPRERLVYDVHEHHVDVASHGTTGVRRVLARLMAGAVERLARRWAGAIVAVNDELARPGARRDQPSVVVTNAAADLDDERVAHAARDPHRVVYVGGLSTPRGIVTLLDAVARLRANGVPVSLDLAGPVLDAEVRAALDAACANGPEGVRYHGRLASPDVTTLLLGASIGVIPFHDVPHYRGTPVKLLEYAMAANAIVTTDRGPKADFVRGASCGACVTPADVAALADALRERVEEPERAREEGMRARAAARPLAWERAERPKLLALYRGLLADAGGA